MMNYLLSMNRIHRITVLYFCFLISFILYFNTGSGWFILLAFFFVGLLIYSNVLYSRKNLFEMEKSLETTLNNINFEADLSYISDDFLSIIALNKLESKLVIAKRNDIQEKFSTFFYDFNDILECSIELDNQTIIQSSKSSAIGNAVVGGALFGSIGAVVGGINSEKIANEKIYKATLSIMLNDIDSPSHEINFLNSNMLIDRNSESYKTIYNELSRWHKTLSVIIKRNELNSESI